MTEETDKSLYLREVGQLVSHEDEEAHLQRLERCRELASIRALDLENSHEHRPGLYGGPELWDWRLSLDGYRLVRRTFVRQGQNERRLKAETVIGSGLSLEDVESYLTEPVVDLSQRSLRTVMLVRELFSADEALRSGQGLDDPITPEPEPDDLARRNAIPSELRQSEHTAEQEASVMAFLAERGVTFPGELP